MFTKQNRKHNKAFTILELLIVIVIIGILAAIVFASWRGIREKATTSLISTELNGAAKTLALYKAEYNNYPESNDCSAGRKPAPPKTCLSFGDGVLYDYMPSADFKGYEVIASKDNITLKISDINTAPIVTTLPEVAAPSAPSVSASTVGNSTTYSWSGAICSDGDVNYQYRYTINNGYDSGYVATTNSSYNATTVNEGYTYTIEVQARCSTVFKNSAWSSVSTTNYYRPMTTPVAPTLAVAYVNPNVVATIGSVTCVVGNTPEYSIRNRTSDGTWGDYSTWSTTMTSSQTASQGIKYGYQARSRCHNSVSDSSYSTSSEVTYTHPISGAPTAPVVAASTSGSTTTYSWSAPTCSVGTPNYQYQYTISGSGYNSGWISTASLSYALNTSTEGSTYTLNAQARCSTTDTSSAWGTSGTATYTRPKSMVATYNISSTAQAQSTVQNLPNLVSVTGVSVNTGTVSYSLSGNNITLNTNNGTASTSSSSVWNAYKYSSYKTSTYGPLSSPSFPGSLSYNDGSYSGTLSYTGYTTGSSSSQTWNSTKYSKTGTATVGPQASSSFASTYSYNDGSYSGTLYYNNYTSGSSSSQVWNATKYSQYLNKWANWQVGSLYPAPSTWPYDSGGYKGTVYYAGWDYVAHGYHRDGSYYNCAGENGYCSFSGSVRYGDPNTSRWAYKTVSGGVSCTNAVFGDPAPNTVKICQAAYPNGWYATEPGIPIYYATYSGTVYQGGYDTTTTYTYTGNYSGTVYMGGYDTTTTYNYTGNYGGTTYMGGYDTVSTTTYPYTITVNYLAY